MIAVLLTVAWVFCFTNQVVDLASELALDLALKSLWAPIFLLFRSNCDLFYSLPHDCVVAIIAYLKTLGITTEIAARLLDLNDIVWE